MSVFYELECSSTGRVAQLEHVCGANDAWYLTVYEKLRDGSMTSVYFGVFCNASSCYSTLKCFGLSWVPGRGFVDYPPLFPSWMVASVSEVV